MEEETVQAGILVTGEELVSGRLLDTNSAEIKRSLRSVGIEVREVRCVGDREPEITRAVEELSSRVDVLIVTGGLGPTEDDRTRDGIAAACGRPLLEHAPARKHVEDIFRRLQRPLAQSNLRQALLPQGSEMLSNPRGTAPGFAFEIDDAWIFALPGVPAEMRGMMEEEVLPRLRQHRAGKPLCEHLLQVVGISESDLGESLSRWMVSSEPPLVSVTAHLGTITVCLADGGDRPGRQRLEQTARAIAKALGNCVYAEGSTTLAEHVVGRLAERGQTLAVAESCTGGLLSVAVTGVAGASDVLLEGCVTYSNDAKVRTLQVPSRVLDQVGAVSEEVARAMAQGVRERAHADWGVGVTGIAGPGGGSNEKPVGLVHVALAGPAGQIHRRLQLFGERVVVQERAVIAVLDLLRLQLERSH